MRKIIVFFVLLGIVPMVRAQNLTNEGTEFYVAFPQMYDQTAALFEINISSRTATSGTVEVLGTLFSQNYTVTPGVVTTITIPSNDANINISEVVIERAIHVTSNAPVTVYASTFHLFRSEASVCLPVPSLSSDYIVTTYPTTLKNNVWYQSEFIVVAGDQPSDITIVPSCITDAGVPAGTPISIHLDPGEVYLVKAQTGATNDLTGTTVNADNGTDKFAVFNGHVWIFMGSCPNTNADPLYEQAYPLEAWGNEYILTLTEDQNENYYRVVAKDNGTTIEIDGVPTGPVLNSGDFYDGTLTNQAVLVTSNKPVSVTQTMTTGVCSGTGDPSIVNINSNEQMFLDTVTFYAIEYNGLDTNYANVVTRTADVGTIELNGTLLTGWTVLAQDPEYSYNIFGIDTGSHTLTTTGCGFLAYTYGLQNAESYFYAAGVRVNSIDNNIVITNISTGNNGPCHLDSILFTPITSGGTVLNYNWDFGDNTTSTLEAPVHIYQSPGTYAVEFIVEYQCQTDTITDNITVSDSPFLSLDSVDVTCFGWENGSITTTVIGGTQPYSQLWNTGATTSDLTGLSGGFYSVVVTDQNGCTDSGAVQIEEPAVIPLVLNPAGPFSPSDGPQNLFGIPAGGAWSATCGTCINSFSGTFDPLAAGPGVWEICYTVTDGGCDSTQCINILVDTNCVMVTYPNDVACFGGENGSFIVNYSGGAGTPSIVFTDADGDQVNLPGTNVANTLSSGWYYIEISDQICSFSDSIFIGQPQELEFTIDITDPLCHGDSTGVVVVGEVFNYTGDPDEISYYWDPNPNDNDGIGQNVLTNVGAGDYNLLVYDENACFKSVDFEIGEPEAISFLELGFDSAYCRTFDYQSGNGVVYAAATGGTGNLTYEWFSVYELNSTTTTTWAGLNPGLYKITVTDDHDCILEEFVQLDSVNPVAAFTPVSKGFEGPGEFEGTELLEVEFINESRNFANPNNPIADTTFSWNLYKNDPSGGNWFFSFDYNEKIDTVYTGEIEYQVCLVAKNFNNCRDSICKFILVHDFPEIGVPNVFTPGANPNNTFFFPAVGLDEFEAIIFNRYGVEVFRFNSTDERWDGNNQKNGKPCQDGVYFYTYKATSTNGTPFEGQGNVTLIRQKN